MIANVEPQKSSRPRPVVVMACAVLLAIGAGPFAFSHRYHAQLGLLVSATLCVVFGWMAFFRYREGESSLRGRIALITSVYLTLSLPAFFIEFSPLLWFVHAHWARIYVRPWIHWGFVPIYLSVACAFFGRGRSRVAFILASTLLAVLWESMSRWI